MASEVEKHGVETKGYYPLGFETFMPHNSQARSMKVRKQQHQRQQQTSHHTKGLGSPKQFVSLPAIHVSKLKERPPRKQTQSLKLPKEIPGNADCSYCHDKTRKRLLPSLASSCVLPKMTGVVDQGMSWWEWSKKEHRIKQTKISLDDAGYYPGDVDVDGLFVDSEGLGQKVSGAMESSRRHHPGKCVNNYVSNIRRPTLYYDYDRVECE